MRNSIIVSSQVSIPVRIDDLAETIWRLPSSDREALEDLLEAQFVKKVLRRAREIPQLRKEGNLLSLDELREEFLPQ